jgi:hypothetical protein
VKRHNKNILFVFITVAFIFSLLFGSVPAVAQSVSGANIVSANNSYVGIWKSGRTINVKDNINSIREREYLDIKADGTYIGYYICENNNGLLRRIEGTYVINNEGQIVFNSARRYMLVSGSIVETQFIRSSHSYGFTQNNARIEAPIRSIYLDRAESIPSVVWINHLPLSSVNNISMPITHRLVLSSINAMSTPTQPPIIIPPPYIQPPPPQTDPQLPQVLSARESINVEFLKETAMFTIESAIELMSLTISQINHIYDVGMAMANAERNPLNALAILNSIPVIAGEAIQMAKETFAEMRNVYTDRVETVRPDISSSNEYRNIYNAITGIIITTLNDVERHMATASGSDITGLSNALNAIRKGLDDFEIYLRMGIYSTTPAPVPMPPTTSIKYYSDFPTVPDFGEFANIPYLQRNVVSIYSTAYLYPLLSIPSDVVDRYYDLLELNGFTFFDADFSNDGFFRVSYIKADIVVSIGASSTGAFVVMITSDFD